MISGKERTFPEPGECATLLDYRETASGPEAAGLVWGPTSGSAVVQVICLKIPVVLGVERPFRRDSLREARFNKSPARRLINAFDTQLRKYRRLCNNCGVI